MPKYLKATAVPASLLELEDYIKGCVACARNERGDSRQQEAAVIEMFAELHEALDIQPVLGNPTTMEVLAKLLEIDIERVASLTSLSVAYLNTLEPEQAVKEMRAALTQPSDPHMFAIQQREAAELANVIVSIQVQTTKLTGAGVEVVSYKEREATHWSLYTRTEDGIATWVEDIKIFDAEPHNHFSEAMVKAAKLSMEHQAFIEQVK